MGQYLSSELKDCDIRIAIFRKSYLKDCKGQRASLVDASVEGCSFGSSVVDNSTVEDTSISDGMFSKSVFTKCDLRAHEIIKCNLRKTEFKGFDLDSLFQDNECIDSTISSTWVKSATSENSTFYDCVLDKIDANGGKIDSSEIHNGTLDGGVLIEDTELYFAYIKSVSWGSGNEFTKARVGGRKGKVIYDPPNEWSSELLAEAVSGRYDELEDVPDPEAPVSGYEGQKWNTRAKDSIFNKAPVHNDSLSILLSSLIK